MAHHGQGVGEEALAHAGLQAVDADHPPVGVLFLQLLDGDLAGLVGAGQAAGEGDIEDVLALFQEGGEGRLVVG